MPVWLAIGIEPMTTEEPYEGNLHVRDCGGALGNRRFYPEKNLGSLLIADTTTCCANSRYYY